MNDFRGNERGHFSEHNTKGEGKGVLQVKHRTLIVQDHIANNYIE